MLDCLLSQTFIAPTKPEAVQAGCIIYEMILQSRLELAMHKSVNAAQVMTFLGISFDSKELTMSVTPDRIKEIRAELSDWLEPIRKYATKRQIQSLAGKLQFIAKCCKPGRCFMFRIFSALKKLSVYLVDINLFCNLP